MNEVEERISRALTDRAEQKPFVERLAATWQALTADYNALVESVRVLDATLAGQPDAVSEKDRHFRDAVVGVLRAPSAGSPDEAHRLLGRLEDASAHIETLLGRVGRPTVNIGVIGVTKAGKSTLLRTVTALPETVIPTTELLSTTAAASRIYHTQGTPSAVVDLHTWQTFRDDYLAPLHAAAHLGAAPASHDDFRRRRYAAPGASDSGPAGTDDVVRKLIEAQQALDSYLGLLLRPERTMRVDFADLRPYVAYPDPHRGDQPRHRPYHAVRSVRIEQTFLDGATRLGFIDLPGSGEAGLNVDTHFVQRVRHEIDLLLMVKRPLAKDAGWFALDGDVLRLADSVRGGAALEDYFMVFLNRDVQNDAHGRFFEGAFTEVTRVAHDRSIQVLTASATNHEDVVEHMLVPALGHLATKLARMDRAAIDLALEESAAASAEVRRFADDLLLRSQRFAQELPNQDFLLRDQVKILLDDLTTDLFALLNDYDAVVAAGAADEALDKGIVNAVTKARAWTRGGLGRGSRSEWLSAISPAYTRERRRTEQDEIFNAKAHITEVFSDIDLSLAESVDELLERVAGVLREHLTPELVPVDAGLQRLRDAAGAHGAWILYRALDTLLDLRIDYGSIVLRVTRPIIREIDPDDSAVRHRSAASEDRGPLAVAVDMGIDAAAMVGGSPVPVSPVIRALAKRFEWRTDSDGKRFRVPVGDDTDPAAPDAPPGGSDTSPGSATPPGGSVRSPVRPDPAAGAQSRAGGAYGRIVERRLRQGAEGLYDDLTDRIDSAVSALEVDLRAEARVMVKALAAAVDQFFETVLRTNEVSRDYELLCGPDRRAIWPEAFGDGSARTAADLSRIAEHARQVIARTGAVGEFRSTLRLPSAISG